ncbi:MAG: hypothetical protein PHQ89_00900 [Bacilli bacterium]|nr:hypothetical protein [Bacilli bacterium]
MNAFILILTNVKNKNFFVLGQNIEKTLKKAKYEKWGTYFKKPIGESNVIIQINDGNDGYIEKEAISSIIKDGCIINGTSNPWNLIMPYIKMFKRDFDSKKDEETVVELINESINDISDKYITPPRVSYFDDTNNFNLIMGLGKSTTFSKKDQSKLIN